MKAAFGLLTDRETSNRISAAAWQAHTQFGTGLSARRLSPHVSLKQPFDAPGWDALEAFTDEFAATIAPFVVELTDLQIFEHPPENPQWGVLSVKVTETPTLRDLHNRLNRELTARFSHCPAPFDGESYSFHCTIAADSGKIAAYRAAFDALSSASFAGAFEARELALFAYDDSRGDWQYMTYKILPLSA